MLTERDGGRRALPGVLFGPYREQKRLASGKAR